MGVQYYRGTDRKGEEQPALPPPLESGTGIISIEIMHQVLEIPSEKPLCGFCKRLHY